MIINNAMQDNQKKRLLSRKIREIADPDTGCVVYDIKHKFLDF